MSLERYKLLNRQSDFERFRDIHPYIQYCSCSISQRLIEYHFRLAPDIDFFHVLEVESEDNISFSEDVVRHLGIVELISYYKLACPKRILLPFELKAQGWWYKLFLNGLGEFFFRNNLLFDELFTFDTNNSRQSRDNKTSHNSISYELKDKSLLLLSGGKDSCVSLELLAKAGRDFSVMLVNPKGPEWKILDTFEKRHFRPARIKINRKIDPRLMKLNEAGYLNGHTPFSAMLAFLSSSLGYRDVFVSNENSANEVALEHNGIKVNHQYSKSFHFEQGVRQIFIGLGSQTNYCSILRPLNELLICKIFSRFPGYLPSFVSCNIFSDRWCGKCPKCVFVYLMLQVYLPTDELNKLFGKDLVLEHPQIIKDLIGLGTKPMECIGTFEECQYALLQGNYSHTKLKELFDIGDPDNLYSEKVLEISSEHNVPTDVLRAIEMLS